MRGLSTIVISILAISIKATTAFIPSVQSSTAYSTAHRPGRLTVAMTSNTNGPDDSVDTDSSTIPVSFQGTKNPLRLLVLKLGFTEIKFTSPLNYEKRAGVYRCASCGCTLFDSRGKYDSGSGWPSFWKTSGGNVALKREWDGRVECSCVKCKGHLGHVFPDGPRRMDVPLQALKTIPAGDLATSNPDNQYTRLPRYCMNGASLRFFEDE